jgi:hypothetical protein
VFRANHLQEIARIRVQGEPVVGCYGQRRSRNGKVDLIEPLD